MTREAAAADRRKRALLAVPSSLAPQRRLSESVNPRVTPQGFLTRGPGIRKSLGDYTFPDGYVTVASTMRPVGVSTRTASASREVDTPP